MPRCYQCKTELKEHDYGRQDSCPKCGFDTRVCKNCMYFDESRYNECKETIADRVVNKEKANYCDYFKPGDPHSADSKADALRKAAEALFKKN